MPEIYPHIILFDGVCNLCNGTVQFIVKRDKKALFKFAALQSAAGKNLLLKFNLPPDYSSSFIYIRNDKIFTKSTAVLNMLHDLGAPWKNAYLLIILPSFVRDFFYGIVAKTRYQVFGKQDTCMVPTEDLKNRFLE